MNVWLLTTEFPPYFGGGIATYGAHLSRLLAHYGHALTVFVHDAEAAFPYEMRYDGPTRIIRFPDDRESHLDNLGPAARLSYDYADLVSRLITAEGAPDVIETQEFNGIGYFLLQRKHTLDPKLQHVPVVVTMHGPKFILDSLDRAPAYRLPDWWTGEMERFVLRAADHIICPSRFIQAALDQHLPGLASTVIPNPYFPFESVVPAVGQGAAHIGRVQYMKGITVLLQGFQRLWDQGSRLPLRVVGGDSFFHPQNQSLTDILTVQYQTYQDAGLLAWEGSLPPDAVQKVMAESRIVVIPSWFETYSYVVIEAMMQGRVVVASSTGVQQAIIESGQNGFLFPAGNVAELAAAISAASALSDDGCRQIGEKARQTALAMTDPERVMAARQALLAKVLNQTPRSSFPFIRVKPVRVPDEKTASRRLSVVVPYFNLGRYIPETLKSLTAVRDLELEILVVDDGSTDPYSIAILYRLEQCYPLHVIRGPNRGLAAARNCGASRARGEYLAFLDADDRVHPDYYRRAATILDHYQDVSFVGAWTQYFDGSTQLWPTWNPEPPYLLFHNTINSSSLVFRRAVFLQYGQNDPDLEYGMEDYETVVRLVGQGFGGVAIPEPLFHYRIRPDSMSRGFNLGNQLYLYRQLAEKNREFFRLHSADLIQLFNANSPQYLIDNPSWPPPWPG
ncbi:MAG: glycosyltransferase [Thermaerobacter sp.]|nr:glycosyltransferase [Thermaerobacter sp.]